MTHHTGGRELSHVHEDHLFPRMTVEIAADNRNFSFQLQVVEQRFSPVDCGRNQPGRCLPLPIQIQPR